MICRCFGHSLDTRVFGRRIGETAALMVGQPSYEAYVNHIEATHPEREKLDRVAFFREREAARFGGGRLRCC